MVASFKQTAVSNTIGFVDKRRSTGPTNADTVATPANYDSVDAMVARLTALGYSAANISNMTRNDMVYAIRLADDSAGI